MVLLHYEYINISNLKKNSFKKNLGIINGGGGQIKQVPNYFLGGSENALGDWEQTGSAGKKQKKNKAKKAVVTKNNLNNEASELIAKNSQIKDASSTVSINGGNKIKTQKNTGATLDTKKPTTEVYQKNEKDEIVAPSYTVSAVKQKLSNNLTNTGKIDLSNGKVSSIGKVFFFNLYYS